MKTPGARRPDPDVRMKGFRQRAEVDEVLRMVLAAADPLPAEKVPVTRCSGRVLAEDVVAPVDVPSFRRSAMDGYALAGPETFGASPDNPLSFRLVGQALPGSAFAGTLGPGEAIRIMTGAAVPAGASAVLPAESAREEGPAVLALGPVTPGKNIGARGEDVRAGTTVLRTGRQLRPQDAGLLSSLGLSPVAVLRRPRVNLLITGDEILPPGSRPVDGAVIDSNSVVLAALVCRDGGQPEPPLQIPDQPDRLEHALQEAAGDVVLISGGSSVGVEDHAPHVLARVGRLAVHGIAMRPSSPTGIGFLPPTAEGGCERLVFLLPGNPVSSLCAYDFFAGPAIRSLGGRKTGWPHGRVTATLARKVISMVGRVDYLRVRLTEAGVEPLAVGGASLLSSTVRADGFAIIGRDEEGRPAGAPVTVFLYDSHPA
ncbi:MAG: gephyrin-like molybdotransferase Glp [Acidobacteriota bacterium]